MDINGSIVVNNSFIGDAHFWIVNSRSEISPKLVRNLTKHQVDKSIFLEPGIQLDQQKGQMCTVANVPIKLGTLKYETVVQMIVQEDSEDSPGRVFLGRDFMDKHKVEYKREDSRIISPDFGEILKGVCREFERIHDRMEVDGELI